MDPCGILYLPLFGSHDVDAIGWLVDDTPDRVSAAIRMSFELSDGDIIGWISLAFADGKVGSIAFSVRSRKIAQ